MSPTFNNSKGALRRVTRSPPRDRGSRNNARPNFSTAVQQMIYRLPQPTPAEAARERRRDRRLEEGVPYATPG